MSADLSVLARPRDPVFGYLTGQMREGQTALLDRYVAESEVAVSRWAPALDVSYGSHPRATVDIFRSPAPRQRALLFFHAGYWQARDKSQFRFIAPAFLEEGVDVALVNYPLCPHVTLATLVDHVRRGFPSILSLLGGEGRRVADVIVAGHSAGAHLAVELALADWHAWGYEAQPIRGIVPVSGVYELRPLRSTRLNDALRLSEDEALALSPLHRLRPNVPQARFMVGALETAEFQLQTQAMHEAWLAQGVSSVLTKDRGRRPFQHSAGVRWRHAFRGDFEPF